MKVSHDQFSRRLESELGAHALTGDAGLLASHAVDGKRPAFFCSPGTPEEVAAALRLCSENEAAVTPWGGGTATVVGNPPRRLDVVIGLTRLDSLMEHDDANLTATVGAGMSLTRLQEIVARRKQFLPFDAPSPIRATVGGTIAANLNGPRRSFYGSVRDLVIGMKVILASGEQIKAGGKVVKNVAGYDMCKLFVGSLGTLGIITEATLRMAPLPEAAATIIASGTLDQMAQFVEALSRALLLPAAVFVVNRETHLAAALPGDWQVALWCEGFEGSLARHLRDALAMAEQAGLNAEILRDIAHRELWEKIRDFPLQSYPIIYRVTVPRASVADVVKIVSHWKTTGFHPAIISDTAMGTLWIASAASQTSAEQFSKLIALAQERRGHAIVLAAPPAFKEGVDIWGSRGLSFSLMGEIKRQFDPKGILNPGRFAAGI